jgi:hypothetical protein
MKFGRIASARLTHSTKKMGILADRLRALTAEMKESDARLQRLIDEHVTSTTANLEELKKINQA